MTEAGTNVAISRAAYQRWLPVVVSFSLGLGGLACLCAGVWETVTAGSAKGVAQLTAAVVLLVVATIDRFETFKAWGIETKARQLDQKLVEAEELTTQLRLMAELSGAALVDLVARTGRWDSTPRPGHLIDLSERVRELLVGVGCGLPVLEAALRPYALAMCTDVANALLHQASQKMTAGYGRAIGQTLLSNGPGKAQLNADLDESRAWPRATGELIAKQSLDNYPAKFLEQFARLPLLEPADAAELQRLAAAVGGGMAELKRSEPISNAELWISLIEKHWAELDRAAQSNY